MSLAKLLLARETENGATGRASRKAVGTALECWAESDFLRHATSEYVDFRPSPRSTIAAVFSPDGRHLASTHGDHTVKVTDVASGRLIHSLQGHRRTPWVVRFSPTDPDVMASGSLDFTAVVWRISTGQLIAKHDFGKPIASLAFDPSGTVLVVTAGHKLYSWQYGQTAVPVKILKTRRSLRALHFHPTAPHILLTAEVTERRAGPGGADGAGPVAVPLPPGAVAGLALVPRAASAGRAPGTAREGRAEGQSMHPQHAQQGGGGGSGGAAGDVSMDGPDPAPEEDPQDAVDELSAFIAAHNSSLGALPLRFFHQRHPQPQPQPPGRPQQQHANAGLGAGQGQGQAVVRHHAQASGAGGAGGGRAGNGAATGAGAGTEAAHPSVWSVVAPTAPVAHEAGAAAAGDGSHAHNEGAAAAAGAGGGGGAGAGGSGAALGAAAAWPMGLLRNLLTGVTGVISGAASSLGVGVAGGGAAGGGGGGGGSDSVQAHAGAAGHAAGGGGGSGGVSVGGPGAVAGAGGAPSVTTVGGAAPGTGAADGGGPARARAAGGGEADVVAAAAAVADSRLSVLSPVDVIRHQSLGGGLRHAIPLVAPAVPPLPPPSLPPSLQHIRGSGPLTPAMQHLSLQNGGLAAQALQAHYHQAAPDGTHAPPDAYAVHMAAAAAAADAHVAPYELTWGWDHRAELGSEELERARQHAVMSAPDLPPAANHDTPCIVTVRLWEFRDPSRELRRELLVLPRVVLCSEMGVHISPCGRYMVCCVVRDSPSEACSQWQEDQQAARHAAVDRAAAATRTHAARTEPSSPDGAAAATAVAPMQCDMEDGGDEAGDLRAADGLHAVVVGGHAAAAALAATGVGDGGGSGGGAGGGGAGLCGVEAARVDSCRSVDMADAGPAGHEPSGSVQAMAGGCAAGPHAEPSVAWHGGGGSGGGGAGMEDAHMHDDTATQACCQAREAAAQPGASSAGPQGAVGCGAGAGLGVAAESGLAKLGKQPSGRRRRARGRGAGSGAGNGAGADSSAGVGPAGPYGVQQLLVAQEEEGHPDEEGVGVGACEAEGGRLGVAADGGLEAGAGEAGEASAAGPQHTVERAAARTAASRPGGDVGVGVGAGEYDSAGAAACRRMTAAAAASVSMSGPNPGSGQAAAAAAAQQAPDHHPRRHSHTHHHGHPHQQGQGQGETGSAAGAAAQGGAAPAGPSRPPLPPAAAPAAAGAPGSHQPQQLHSQQPEPLTVPQPQPPQQPQSPGEGATPHMFASIKEKLAQQRSLDEAAGARSVAVADWAPAAPGAGAGAGAGAAGGAHQAAAPLTEELSPVVCERAAADSGVAAATMPPHWAAPGREAGTPMDAAAAARHAGGDAMTTAARPQAQPAATAAAAQKASGHASGPFYELCIFYTGASPMAPSNAAPAMPSPTPSSSKASVAFPAAGSGAAASSRAAAAAATGAAAVGPHFGALLHARPVLAAHCMTSLQFSPTGRHVLVSYGRRHISLCSLVACAEQLAAVHSVVEVYSVPDMVLRRVLLSTDDEVNVAVFNAFPGGGMAYGTKEGRLRLLRYDRRPPLRSVIPFMPLPGSDSADGGAPRGADGAAAGLAEDEDELDLDLDQALWNGADPLAGTGDPHDGHPSFFTRFT